MPVIIHSVYEIVRELGSGGAGNVYLANHLNMKKLVVLKADKRKITVREDILRREVDVLKNLSHTYIPQVHDYFIEDDTVYTEMDYINGESLDKPLNRGEKFTQPQVIKWACQLLEALEYLHEPVHGDPPKGYVHSDIKPSNIMRTPENDIRLIDFNIALALGELNAVGHSAGYASPEHYGICCSSDSEYTNGKTACKTEISDTTLTSTLNELTGSTEHTSIEKESDDDSYPEIISDPPLSAQYAPETVIEKNNAEEPLSENNKRQTNEGSSASGRKKIMPDVRSDIYMVGATLYHLLSGKRPEKDALKVVPLSYDEFTPQIVDIIKKAMSPDPDMRFQTASEMLYAFEHLYENDIRMIKFRRHNTICRVSISVLLAAGIFTSFTGLKRMQVTERRHSLSGYSREALEKGDIKSALNYAGQAVSDKTGIFIPGNTAEAQLALTNALGIYDISDGYKSYKTLSLPSEPLFISLSPEGKTAACIYSYELAVTDTLSGEITDTLPSAGSALSEVRYIDENNIVFAGASGITGYNIPNKSILWTGEAATAVSLSSDGRRAAGIYKDEPCACIYDTQNGHLLRKTDFRGKKQSAAVNDSFANPGDNLLALNADGTIMAVSFADGTLSLYDISQSDIEYELLNDGNQYTHFEGGFFGQYFAFSAYSPEKSVFAVIDTDTMEQTGGFESSDAFRVTADETGITVQTEDILVNIDPVTGEQTPLCSMSDDIWSFACSEKYSLISTKSNFMFYDSKAEKISEHKSSSRSDFLEISPDTALVGSMDSPVIQILRFESHTDTEISEYDSGYEHLEARVTADWEKIVMFSYEKFRICDIKTKKITDVDIPDAENVNDQQFIRENNSSYLEVRYNDGRIIDYSADSGDIISDTRRDAPDMSLYEEFRTASYRITNPLHGTPEVYDADSGKLIGRINEKAYLTYASQVGKQIITQYITADGYRYGQILNEKCEVIAELPYLCDVFEEKLVFDYPSGNIRVSPVYSLEHLIKAADK